MARDGNATTDDNAGPFARQALMRICSFATAEELAFALKQLKPIPEVESIRQPEIGLVMLRGRIGGDGGAFNVGEATVTRCVVRLATGAVGFSYILGRAPEKARHAAIVDALGQDGGLSRRIDEVLVAPVSARLRASRQEAQAETAATRVQFFTLVRGED